MLLRLLSPPTHPLPTTFSQPNCPCEEGHVQPWASFPGHPRLGITVSAPMGAPPHLVPSGSIITFIGPALHWVSSAGWLDPENEYRSTKGLKAKVLTTNRHVLLLSLPYRCDVTILEPEPILLLFQDDKPNQYKIVCRTRIWEEWNQMNCSGILITTESGC